MKTWSSTARIISLANFLKAEVEEICWCFQLGRGRIRLQPHDLIDLAVRGALVRLVLLDHCPIVGRTIGAIASKRTKMSTTRVMLKISNVGEI